MWLGLGQRGAEAQNLQEGQHRSLRLPCARTSAESSGEGQCTRSGALGAQDATSSLQRTGGGTVRPGMAALGAAALGTFDVSTDRRGTEPEQGGARGWHWGGGAGKEHTRDADCLGAPPNYQKNRLWGPTGQEG